MFSYVVVPLDVYLKKINCDPFFFISTKTKLIEVSLDNPKEDHIIAKAYYTFFPSE